MYGACSKRLVIRMADKPFALDFGYGATQIEYKIYP